MWVETTAQASHLQMTTYVMLCPHACYHDFLAGFRFLSRDYGELDSGCDQTRFWSPGERLGDHSVFNNGLDLGVLQDSRFLPGGHGEPRNDVKGHGLHPGFEVDLMEFCQVFRQKMAVSVSAALPFDFCLYPGILGRDGGVCNNTNGHRILQIPSREIMASPSTLVSMGMKEKWNTFFVLAIYLVNRIFNIQ
ncbi:uncharacterized protein LOC102513453 [Camelus ferus]|uniref:Uncharacterized protein LOC102513453 n=1 Tax=Camelus ferus TaxID=419612 RepID=A0A8B8SM01_CAMFR|nr:uncharacterized protein LOC102513453 [Camelus ferus]